MALLNQWLLFHWRFDGLDGLAEHDDFLPHKAGVKKENHFTDVSASAQQYVRKHMFGFCSWFRWIKTFKTVSLCLILSCSSRGRLLLACPSLTSVTLLWAAGFWDWLLRCPTPELFFFCEYASQTQSSFWLNIVPGCFSLWVCVFFQPPICSTHSSKL